MIGAGVVRHLILDHLQAEAVRRFHQLAVLGEVAEVLVHGVEVHRAVTVVVGDGGAVVALALVEVIHVVVDGRGPDRGDAEVLQVGQAVDDPLQVATVVVARPAAVVEAAGARGVVVGGIPVREPVRHDQVHHVVGRESLESTVARERRAQLEGDVGRTARRGEA